MTLYDYAENSLEIERYLIDRIDAFNTLEEAKAFITTGDNWKPFKIEVIVTPIEE